MPARMLFLEVGMNLAILSDIHGNLVALDTVLAEFAQRSIDQYICLGDVASSGPQPHQVLERLRGFDWFCVQGNMKA
jgi:predicted phosphodiesterase